MRKNEKFLILYGDRESFPGTDGSWNSKIKELWGENADEWNPNRFMDHKKPTTMGMFRLFKMEVYEAVLDGDLHEVEIDQTRPGISAPYVKGHWEKGSQMPLTVTIRSKI
ncbi:hypothetical protein L218DRAFT_947368 [Marasmius fiardii PR-910]|nr:hypothetical protein L218DRAFT_947368 [Marasmius fiardii PR-910]